MANQDLAKTKPDTEVDEAIWRELPLELVEKCLGHLPVLTIASKLREVNKAWRDYAGTLTFMKLHNHGKNLNSSFGFLMYGTNPSTNQCETMACNHEDLKWQMARSLPIQSPHDTCIVESVSEGLLLLSPRSAWSPVRAPPRPRSFIVWNPLLGCQQAVPEICHDYTNVILMVDRATGTFKIVAFSASYRDCLTYSPTTGSWQSVNPEEHVNDGLYFPQHEGDHIAIAYKNCVYVAVKNSRNGVLEVGDLCYDVERNVWKPAVMCKVSLATMELYADCFTMSMFVVNDVLYKVLIYEADFYGSITRDRRRPTGEILARSLVHANNAGDWKVIASTVLPDNDHEIGWVGSWYACRLEGHEKPTICGLFVLNSEPLYMMMYDVGKSTWKKVCVKIATNKSQRDGSVGRTMDSWYLSERRWRSIKRKWTVMRMALHYTPSWICPAAAQCTRHQNAHHGGAHGGAF